MSKEIKDLLDIFNNPKLTSKEREHYALKIVALLNANREKAKS
jgi:hypothetical protein